MSDPHDDIMRDHASELFLALEILLAVTGHVDGPAAFHAREIAGRVMARARGVRDLRDPDPIAIAFAAALEERFPQTARGAS